VEVWQTSNLRRLRLGEEKEIEEYRRQKKTTGQKIYWPALFHRADIKKLYTNGIQVKKHLRANSDI